MANKAFSDFIDGGDLASGDVVVGLRNGTNYKFDFTASATIPSPGFAGSFLRSDGANWAASSATIPNTFTVNSLVFASSTNTLDEITTANSATLVTNSSGVPSWTASMTDGQVLIGSTGSTPVPATLTAGSGISISEGAGSITIAGTGSGIGWTEVTGTTQAAAADSGYITNNASQVVITMPATAAVGTCISVIGKGAGGWRIDHNAGQNIQLGSSSTTTGSGYIESTNRYDSIDLICTTADTTWTTLGAPQGSITVV